MPSLAEIARDLADFIEGDSRRADVAKAAAEAIAEAGFGPMDSLAYAGYADLEVATDVSGTAKALIRTSTRQPPAPTYGAQAGSVYRYG